MRVCSAAFLIRGNRVLLAKRSPDRSFYPDVWDAVGGHVEAGETPETTMIREVMEELGVRPIMWRRVAVLDEPDPTMRGPVMCYVFAVTHWEGEPRIVNDEHSALRWCTFGDLVSLSLADPSYPAVIAGVIRQYGAVEGPGSIAG